MNSSEQGLLWSTYRNFETFMYPWTETETLTWLHSILISRSRLIASITRFLERIDKIGIRGRTPEITLDYVHYRRQFVRLIVSCSHTSKGFTRRLKHWTSLTAHCPRPISLDKHRLDWVRYFWWHKKSIAAMLSFYSRAKL